MTNPEFSQYAPNAFIYDTRHITDEHRAETLALQAHIRELQQELCRLELDYAELLACYA